MKHCDDGGVGVPTRVGATLGDCRHDGNLPKKERHGTGWRYFFYCETCERKVTDDITGRPGKFISEEDLRRRLPDGDISGVKILSEFEYRLCSHCRRYDRCEMHHVFVRAVAEVVGEDADEWPLIWLCRACHTLWHDAHTPGLISPHDPLEHAALLLHLLKSEKFARLLEAMKRVPERSEAA